MSTGIGIKPTTSRDQILLKLYKYGKPTYGGNRIFAAHPPGTTSSAFYVLKQQGFVRVEGITNRRANGKRTGGTPSNIYAVTATGIDYLMSLGVITPGTSVDKAILDAPDAPVIDSTTKDNVGLKGQFAGVEKALEGLYDELADLYKKFDSYENGLKEKLRSEVRRDIIETLKG